MAEAPCAWYPRGRKILLCSHLRYSNLQKLFREEGNGVAVAKHSHIGYIKFIDNVDKHGKSQLINMQ